VAAADDAAARSVADVTTRAGSAIGASHAVVVATSRTISRRSRKGLVTRHQAPGPDAPVSRGMVSEPVPRELRAAQYAVTRTDTGPIGVDRARQGALAGLQAGRDTSALRTAKGTRAAHAAALRGACSAVVASCARSASRPTDDRLRGTLGTRASVRPSPSKASKVRGAQRTAQAADAAAQAVERRRTERARLLGQLAAIDSRLAGVRSASGRSKRQGRKLRPVLAALLRERSQIAASL
jgi:hypothetical protein